jgi:hypothetical protein
MYAETMDYTSRGRRSIGRCGFERINICDRATKQIERFNVDDDVISKICIVGTEFSDV